MNIETSLLESTAVKLTIDDAGNIIGHAYLYLIRNDLHSAPYGLLEDVFIEEPYRGKGYGSKLVEAAIAEAKKRGCYKLIGTSRHERKEVHVFYERLGFKNYGLEFRLDLGAS
jgi:GNAT superfamily N-acetyltransferase